VSLDTEKVLSVMEQTVAGRLHRNEISAWPLPLRQIPILPGGIGHNATGRYGKVDVQTAAVSGHEDEQGGSRDGVSRVAKSDLVRFRCESISWTMP
jgi:hypothetical protein